MQARPTRRATLFLAGLMILLFAVAGVVVESRDAAPAPAPVPTQHGGGGGGGYRFQ
jgi:hypothetical protein